MKINNWTFDNVQKSVSTTLCSYPTKKALKWIQGDLKNAQGIDESFWKEMLVKHAQAGGSSCCEEQPKGKAGSPGAAAACTPVKPPVELAVRLLFCHSANALSFSVSTPLGSQGGPT